MARCIYKEEKHVIPRHRLIEYVNGGGDIRAKALVSIQYLTASRVFEVSKLRRGDVRVVDDLIKFRLVTAKRRGSHKNEFRYVNIPRENTKPFSDHIVNYLKIRPKIKDILLFPGERMCQKITKELTGHGTHCLRHSRLTHLAEKGWNQFLLQKFVNWGKADQALEYVKISGIEIEKNLREVGI